MLLVRTSRPLTSLLHSGFALLSLTDSELQWLKKSCTNFTPDYLSYLSSYRFKPEQVSIHFVPLSSDGQQGNVEILVSGLWVEVILWEVPLMACLSESYFQTVMTDWSYDGQEGMLLAPYEIFVL